MRKKKLNPTPDQLSMPEQVAMYFIQRYVAELNQPPSVREIAEAIHLSVSATHDLIKRLIEYGYLAPRYTTHRRRVRNIMVKRPLERP
jgi:DNA-binding MarR family transcriptional regulator